MNRGRFLRISATAGVLLFGPYQRSLPKCATSNSQKRFTSPSSRTALSSSPASRSRRTSTAKKGARFCLLSDPNQPIEYSPYH